MTLGRRTALILVTASLTSLALSYFVLRTTFYSTFIDLENGWTASNLARVESAIDAQLTNFLVLNREWSQWNETYQFLQDQNDEYVREYFIPESFESVDIDSLVILDRHNRFVAGMGRDAASPDGYRVNYRFQEFETFRANLAGGDEVSREQTGTLMTRFGPMLVASAPILRTDGSGPSAGTLIFARYLTKPRLQQLSDQLGIDFDVFSADSDLIPHSIQGILDSIETMPLESRQIHYPEEITTYGTLRNLNGKPSVVVEVTTSRQISVAGGRALVMALIFLTLASLLYLAVSNLSLQIMIVAPVRRLTAHINQMRQSGRLGRIQNSARNDELGTLTQQFNSLVQELKTAQSTMARARDEAASARDVALAASQSKSQFLANMSHEIRTPINGVLGMTGLLLSSTALNQRQREYAEMIARSGNTLLSVINDILDFSKIEAGKLDLDSAPFDIRQAIEESLELMAEQADAKGLELLLDVPPGLPKDVIGDAKRLHQILVNLIGNAVKFTYQGEIVVRMIVVPEEGDDLVLRIEVQDTGIGIDPDCQSRIFESFSQADNSSTRNFGGTGLGLAISRQLVKLMGGEIGIESTLGEGSTFWFTTRWTKGDCHSAHPSMLDGLHALVVDDNATNRQILRQQLEYRSMKVTEASSGTQALAELHKPKNNSAPYDLVILDFHMPDMNGLEVARGIQQEPTLQEIPLILLSSISAGGLVGEEQPELAARLTKPIRQIALHDCLTRVCGRSIQAVQPARECAGPAIAKDGAFDRGFRVLLVEDDEVNQTVAEGMLIALGGETKMVTNGLEALALLKEQAFDLVLMDCQMPVMDGYAATRAIRQWEAEQKSAPTPVIALTANSFESDRQQCLAAGMNDYMSKPFTLERLRDVLGAHLVEGDVAAPAVENRPAKDDFPEHVSQAECRRSSVD